MNDIVLTYIWLQETFWTVNNWITSNRADFGTRNCIFKLDWSIKLSIVQHKSLKKQLLRQNAPSQTQIQSASFAFALLILVIGLVPNPLLIKKRFPLVDGGEVVLRQHDFFRFSVQFFSGGHRMYSPWICWQFNISLFMISVSGLIVY